MQRDRLVRASIIATVLCTLLVPTVGSVADQKKKLSKTRQELSRVRDRLQVNRAEAGSLRKRINSLENEITRIQIAINKLDAEIAEVRSEVRAVEAHIAATGKKISAIEDRATQQAVALYKQGSTDVLAALLSSTSLAELDARAEMLGIAAQENTGTLIAYGRLKVEIEEQNRILLAKERELGDKRDDRAALLDKLSSRKQDLDENYKKVSQRVVRLKDREGDLAAAARAIENRIIAAQAKRSVTSLGKSKKGYIWPLNGPVTSGYGPRWGRMHTGIDIDGYTGQPIVAAKGGRVIMASSYSGYGNTVIIDHGGGYSSLYAHMSSFGTSAGANVSQGDVIGTVGCSGSCTGDHLHFEIRVNGSPVNPMPYLP